MEIDPHNLPSEVNLLQQIVLQLLQTVEDKDQLLAHIQYQLAQLLRYRYGQKRERIDENRLFLFAAQIIAASQRASTAASSEEPAADSSSRADEKEKKEKPERRGHGRKALPESLERRRVVFDLEESQRQCGQCQTPMRKIGEGMAAGAELVSPVWERMKEVVLTSRRPDRRYASASAGSRANSHAHRPDLDVCGGSQPSLHRLRLHRQT